MLEVNVIELTNNSWSWNEKLMSNINHRSLFNNFMSSLLIDNTRYLVIFLNKRSLSDRPFRVIIALKTAFFKENYGRHDSRIKVRNLRRLLKIIFLYFTSANRTRWSYIIQFSDDFLFSTTKIDSIVSIEDLPITNIIEPDFFNSEFYRYFLVLSYRHFCYTSRSDYL